MRKILDTYIKDNWLHIFLNDRDSILFYIDRLLYYHKEHLILRWLIDNEMDEMIIKWDIPERKKQIRKRIDEQVEINNNIRAHFILFIIELAKIFESNSAFKKIFNKLWCVKYERLHHWKPKKVKTLSDTVIHFRDACVHNKNKEISTRPEFKKHKIEWRIIHLDFVCDGNSSARVFMIWHWKISFDKIESMIKELLKHYYTRF